MGYPKIREVKVGEDDEWEYFIAEYRGGLYGLLKRHKLRMRNGALSIVVPARIWDRIMPQLRRMMRGAI